MLKLWVLCCVLCCGLPMAFGNGDMGPGLWQVDYIKKCDDESHTFHFSVNQTKLNRTHDCFNADINLSDELDDSYGIKVEISKNVDGGYKLSQVLADESFCNFVNKYARNNVRTCLEMAKVDPPEFPIAKGDYQLLKYMFDYSELPENGSYGTYCAKSYLMKNNRECSCVEIYLEFKEKDDDYEDK